MKVFSGLTAIVLFHGEIMITYCAAAIRQLSTHSEAFLGDQVTPAQGTVRGPAGILRRQVEQGVQLLAVELHRAAVASVELVHVAHGYPLETVISADFRPLVLEKESSAAPGVSQVRQTRLFVEILAIGEGVRVTEHGIHETREVHALSPVVRAIFLPAEFHDLGFFFQSDARNQAKRWLASIELDRLGGRPRRCCFRHCGLAAP